MAEYYLQHYGYVSSEPYLAHHGIKGQQWGVKHGPPYPLDANTNRDIRMSRNTTEQQFTQTWASAVDNGAEIV